MYTKKLFMLGLYFLFCACICFAQTTDVRQEKNEENTPEQKAKLKQAEELADKFVQRWHETLDLKILDEEYFIKNPKFREENKIKEELEADGEVGEGDKAFFKEFVYVYYASHALGDEMELVFGRNQNNEINYPEEFQKNQVSFEKALADFGENEIGKKEWSEYFDLEKRYFANLLHNTWPQMVKLYKDVLPLSIFSKDEYQKRLEKEYPPKVEIALSSYYLNDDSSLPCYAISRGVFDLVIIEENNEMRVLRIDMSRYY